MLKMIDFAFLESGHHLGDAFRGRSVPALDRDIDFLASLRIALVKTAERRLVGGAEGRVILDELVEIGDQPCLRRIALECVERGFQPLLNDLFARQERLFISGKFLFLVTADENVFPFLHLRLECDCGGLDVDQGSDALAYVDQVSP